MRPGSFSLLAKDLPAFTEFVKRRGYIAIRPTGHTYEVARFSLYDHSGDNPPLVIYSRKRNSLLTVTDDGMIGDDGNTACGAWLIANVQRRGAKWLKLQGVGAKA